MTKVWLADDGDWWCDYCWGDQGGRGLACSARSPEYDLHCTRDMGHGGPHVACGVDSNCHAVETWEEVLH